MNKQTIIIFAAGLFVILIVALLTQSMMRKEPEAEVFVEEIAPTEILVAAANLRKGDVLLPDSVTWQTWPETMAFADATIRGGALNAETVEVPTGRLRRDIPMGQIILQSDIAQDETGNFVAATLADGMRAVAIEVNAGTAVSGFIKPGDMVDVIMSYEVRMPADQDIADASVHIVNRNSSQTILENVRVMAIDQTATEVEGVATSRTIALEVSPDQAEQLALASELGTLSLSLRKQGDETIRITNGHAPRAVTDTRMSNALQEIMGGEDAIRLFSLSGQGTVYVGMDTDTNQLDHMDHGDQ